MQTTIKRLESIVSDINRIAKRPPTAYTRNDENKFIANLGNFHLAMQYQCYELHEMFNSNGGIQVILYAKTKSEMEGKLLAFRAGLSTEKL